MIADSFSKTSKDRIFTVLHEIDLKVGRVKKKGIIFVGLSRVGKSTAYNWTIRHPLEAKIEQIIRSAVPEVTASSTRKRERSRDNRVPAQNQTSQKATNVTYVPRIIQTDTGQVRSGIKSCTLVPNIIDLDEQTIYLDMPGYGDSRDYIGTLGVSYSLRAVFEVLQEVKFIVVVTEAMLNNIKLLSDTLNHFFGMFDLQTYPDIEKNIFDATSLLITHSVNYGQHYDLINEASQQLEDPELSNINNRELISDFLYYIGKKVNRFREFRKARLSEPPEECNIIQSFNNKGWKFLNLKALREQLIKNPQHPDIIKLPFQKEFLNMKISEQEDLKASIDRRLRSYRILAVIISSLYENIFVQGSTNDIKLPYGTFLNKIRTFVTENDHYNSERYLPQNFMLISQFSKPQKQTLFYLLLKMKDIVSFDDTVLGSSKRHIKPTMDLFKRKITQLVDLISVIFCRNREDYRLMLQLKFILLRGIREFYMLLHVSHEKVSSYVNEIHDSFQLIFPPDYHDYWQKFLLSFKLNQEERICFGQRNQQNYMERYIQTREDAYAMEVLFKTHQQNIMTLKSKLIDRYYEILRDVKLIHARHQFQQYEYRKCLIYLHEAITLQTKFQKNCIKRLEDELDETKIDIMMKVMHINQENIYQMFKMTFIKLNNFQTALSICKELNWVHSTCEIYDTLLMEKGRENKEMLQEYAIYCMDHGLPEKGRALFHRLLEVEKTFEKKKEILEKIQFYVQNPEKSTSVYLKFLTQQYFLDLNDFKRENLLKTISQSIKEENHNIEKIIDIIRNQFNSQNKNQEQIQHQQILIKYLQTRDNSQAFCTANGFSVNYNQSIQNIPTFFIGNAQELKRLNIWLIQHLETVSKLTKNDLKGKKLKIDVKQLDPLSISEKIIIITLDGQQIKKTFEYAVKIMKIIKKLIYEQHEKLLMVIKLAHETIQKTDVEIRDYLLEEYRDSITKEEIQAIKSIIQKMPKANNQAIESEYRKLYKEPKLVRSELTSIFDYIRQKNCEEIYREVKQKMMEMSNAKDPSSEMDCTRDYY